MRRERKEKEETHDRKSNECMLLAEIPRARLGDSDWKEIVFFSLSD